MLKYLPLFAAILLISCSNDRRIDARYDVQLASYDCKSLSREADFQATLINRMNAASSDYSVANDVIGIGLLDLGVGNLVTGNSMTGKSEYARRTMIAKERLKMVEGEYYKRCNGDVS